MDRNSDGVVSGSADYVSLSARRAWIEIPVVPAELTTLVKSLSARRAWIEIYYADKDCDWVRVALRKESVDRNAMRWNTCEVPTSRSPQGERG